MKNLFLVVNKEKIYAYVVSIMTIVVIFFMSSRINSELKDTESASSNGTQIVENNLTIENNENAETSGIIGEAIYTDNTLNNEVTNN